jgi:hypothetical protein
MVYQIDLDDFFQNLRKRLDQCYRAIVIAEIVVPPFVNRYNTRSFKKVGKDTLGDTKVKDM